MPVIKPNKLTIRAGRKPSVNGKAESWLQIRVTRARKQAYKKASGGNLSQWVLTALDEKLPKDNK